MTRPDARAVVALLCLSGLLWAPRLAGPIDLRYDAGVYYVLGTSLADGKGYRLLNEPGEVEAVQYPPLLPLLVAGHQLALGTTDPDVVGRFLRLTFGLVGTLYVLAAYAVARPFLPPARAFLVALITALHLPTVFLSDLLFAEVPFALAAAVFVLLNRRADRPAYFVLTALAGAAAFLLRTAGLALLAAWVAEAVLKRRYRQALARAAVALVPVVAWHLYTGRVTTGDEYRRPAYAYQRAPYQYYNVTYAENVLLVEPFAPELGRATPADLAARFARNLAAMPTALGEGVTAGGNFWDGAAQAARTWLGVDVPRWLLLAPATVLGGLVVAGAVVLAARREWFVPAYLAASVALICLTPWPGQFSRYLAPLTPFLALCLVRLLVAVRESAARRGPGARRAARWGSAAVVAGVLTVQVLADLHAYLFRHTEAHARPGGRGGRLFYYDHKWAAFDAALDWLAGRAGPGDVVVTTAPQRAHLKVGAKAVMPPMEPDAAKAQELLDGLPARYVVVDDLDFLDISRRYAAPAVEAHPRAWRLVHSVPGGGVRVYERVP